MQDSEAIPPIRPHQLERRIRPRLDAISPAARAELLHALMFPESAADRIGAHPEATGPD
jgi:hypothetical protein